MEMSVHHALPNAATVISKSGTQILGELILVR